MMGENQGKFGLEARPRIDPTIVPVRISQDRVHFRAGPWSGPILTMSDEDREGKLCRIIESLDGSLTVGEILEVFGSEYEPVLTHILGELSGHNIVHDVRRLGDSGNTNRTPVPVRFSAEDVSTLSSKSVCAVTSGRIAEPLLSMLTQTRIGGVKNFHVGEPSPDVSESVSSFSPDSGSLRDAVDASEMVLFAVSEPVPELMSEVNQLAHETNTPLVYTETLGYDVTIGPTIIPGETACYECYRRRRNSNIEAPGNYSSFEKSLAVQNQRGVNVLPFPQIASGFLVTDVLNYLCYGYGYTVGSIIHFGMEDFSFESNDVLRIPRCPVCSDDAAGISTDSLFTVDSIVKQLPKNETHED